MKSKIYLVAVVLAAAALFNGCAKDGDTGPAGPAGANGSNGTNGNSNVILTVFGTQNLSSTTTFVSLSLPAPITSNMVDSSLLLVYHQNGGNWYGSPGLGYGSGYNTRAYTSGTTLYLQIQNADGSTYTGGAQTFSKVRVIVAPSTDYKGSRPGVDFSDYYATLKYFNLKDL